MQLKLKRSQHVGWPSARIEADHVVLACKFVDMLQPTQLAKHSVDAHAWSARDEQKHALLASRLGRRDAAGPKRELHAVWNAARGTTRDNAERPRRGVR